MVVILPTVACGSKFELCDGSWTDGFYRNLKDLLNLLSSPALRMSGRHPLTTSSPPLGPPLWTSFAKAMLQSLSKPLSQPQKGSRLARRSLVTSFKTFYRNVLTCEIQGMTCQDLLSRTALSPSSHNLVRDSCSHPKMTTVARSMNQRSLISVTAHTSETRRRCEGPKPTVARIATHRVHRGITVIVHTLQT